MIGRMWMQAAERIAAARAERLAERVRAALGAERDGTEVRLRGRDLARRRLSDPALRFAGRLA